MATPPPPTARACPACGSKDSSPVGRGILSSARVCRNCGTRYQPPVTAAERYTFAAVFLVPALLGLGLAALGVALVAAALPKDPSAAVIGLGCVGFIGIASLLAAYQGVRELRRGRAARVVGEVGAEAPDTRPARLLPRGQAEDIVRDAAERARAKGILDRLGRLPPEKVGKARARYAQDVREEEARLVLVDTSFLQNGAAGLLLTNRALYSSRLPRPIPLGEIDAVSYRPANPFLPTAFAVVVIALHFIPFFPRMILLIPLDVAYLVWLLVGGWRDMRNVLSVNGHVVYQGTNSLRHVFWMDVLPELARAMREAGIEALHVGALEVGANDPDGRPGEPALVIHPTWADIQQRLRALDGAARPSVRLWAGGVGQGSALDVLGGSGTYVLREVGGGWVYYDPEAGEEEVVVCTGDPGYRTPAYHVCRDLDRVLLIARSFAEIGSLE